MESTSLQNWRALWARAPTVSHVPNVTTSSTDWRGGGGGGGGRGGVYAVSPQFLQTAPWVILGLPEHKQGVRLCKWESHCWLKKKSSRKTMGTWENDEIWRNASVFLLICWQDTKEPTVSPSRENREINECTRLCGCDKTEPVHKITLVWMQKKKKKKNVGLF